jgi:hypothetical protein
MPVAISFATAYTLRSKGAFYLEKPMSDLFLSCITCNPDVFAGIFTPEFLPIFGMIASQFIVAAALVSFLRRIK